MNISTIFIMIKLKNFDDLNDFNLDKEEFKFPSITHCNDEVYIEPLNAIYEVPDNTISVMLSDNKSLFKSFICNGVEMINNDIMPLYDYSEQPLMLYGKSEKVTKRSQYNLKTNVVLTEITQSGYIGAISFDGNKLVDGEQSIYLYIEDYFNKLTKYFVCGTEEFNNFFTWNEEFKVYMFDITLVFDMMAYGEFFEYQMCGVNNPNSLASEDDMIPTLVYNDLGGDGLGTSSVQVEMLDVITKYELDVESCSLPRSTFDANNDGLGNIILTFNRPFEEGDYMVYNMYCKKGDEYHIFDESIVPYNDFKDMFTLVEGTESSYYYNYVNTYIQSACEDLHYAFTLTKNTDGILLTEDDFVDYTLEYENYFPIEDKVLNCKFKFKDDIDEIAAAFRQCYELVYLNFSNIDLSKMLHLDSLCSHSPKIKEVVFGKQNTSNLETINNLFNQCYSLKTFDLYNLNLSNCNSTSNMFGGSNLERINLKGVDFKNSVFMSELFYNCEKLVSITFDSELNDNVNCTNMFKLVTSENGKLYYNKKYDYSKIIEQLPSTWKAIPVDME